MRKVTYYFTDDEDSIREELEVPDNATDTEVNDLILNDIAEKIYYDRWMVEWDYEYEEII